MVPDHHRAGAGEGLAALEVELCVGGVVGGTQIGRAVEGQAAGDGRVVVHAGDVLGGIEGGPRRNGDPASQGPVAVGQGQSRPASERRIGKRAALQ